VDVEGLDDNFIETASRCGFIFKKQIKLSGSNGSSPRQAREKLNQASKERIQIILGSKLKIMIYRL
jgi:hypothetical protein